MLPDTHNSSGSPSRSTIRLVAPVLTALLVMLAAAVISFEVLSTIRAYVGGESLYSKGQKNATYYLAQYASSQSEEDFRQYRAAIAFPLGDMEARLALQHRPVDLEAAREGFLQGGNDSADVPSIILLFRAFGGRGPMRKALDIWAQGDSYTLRLCAIAARLHPAGSAAPSAAERAEIRAELSEINRELTPLSARFSATLGDLARLTRTVLAIALTCATAITGFLCIRVIRARVLILAKQHQILHLIATGGDLELIFTDLVQFLETHGNPAALIALDASGTSYGLTVAPSLPSGFGAALAEANPRAQAGPWAQAVSSARPVTVRDLATRGMSDALRRYLEEAHLESVSIWPILGTKKQVLGLLSVFPPPGRRAAHLDTHTIEGCTALAGIAVESRRAAERIEHLAHHDDLTGLPNRLLFNEQLPRAIARAQGKTDSLAVLFFDLDRFKIINDTLGHATGDGVLQQISGHLLACVGPTDLLARIGGDEFALLVEDFAGIAELDARVRKLLAAMASPLEIGPRHYQLSGSIGISIYPKDGTDGTSLLKNADIAMYRAKAAGRNRHEFYSSELSTHSIQRLTLESELRQAVARGEFDVHYQPKIEIRSGRVCGAEALVRWQHPSRGLLLPAEFIVVAEEVGLIGDIGRWVLKGVCADIVRWRTAGLEPGRIAINLSAQQFADVRLLDDLEEVLRQTHCEPAWLEFEITESVVMTNPERALHLLEQIKAYGITLAIDDFGTGHSSLAYLKRFPVDRVKIDHAFIRDIATDPDDLAIVDAIIALGHSLGLQIVAEGVESAAQLQILSDHRCDECQGFLFSRAVTPAAYALMRQGEVAYLDLPYSASARRSFSRSA